MTATQGALESLLSKKNLVRDPFLAGNMNPQMYIPISVLLAHEKLQAAGATVDSVLAAAKKSARLGVDEKESMVRPLLKSKRNVIILRDVSKDTTEAEVRALFANAPHGDKVKSVKAEINNTWFVKLDLDEGTQDVVLWLRSQTLKGRPVNAAIKSEHFLRSFFPLHLHPGTVPTPQQAWGPPGDPTGAPVPEFDPTQAMAWGPPMGMAAGFPGKGGFGQPMPGGKGGSKSPVAEFHPGGAQQGGFWKDWGKKSQPPPLIFSSATTLLSSSITPIASQGPDSADYAGGRTKGKGKDAKGGGDRSSHGKGADKSAKGAKSERREARGERKWAAREPREHAEAPIEASDIVRKELVVPSATYKHEFRKYSRETFETLCKALAEEPLERPACLGLFASDTYPILREAPSIEVGVA